MPYLEIVNDSLARIEVRISGLPSLFFDRTNNLSLWSIVELFLTAGHPPENVKFSSRQDLYKMGHLMSFVVQMSCSLTPEIHLISKYVKPNIRLAMSTSLYHIGKSSYSMLTSMTNVETKEKLGEFFLKLVIVDRTTRKSTPLPKTFVENFRNIPFLYSNAPYPIPVIPEMPDTIFAMTFTARHSDMDQNYHVTTNRYVQSFTDCATEAANDGFYKHFNDDMCRYPVEKFDVTLLGESKVGDKLRVCTWQDEVDVQTIYFSCFNGSTCVMKAAFVYGMHVMAPKIPPHYL
ncbi:uncharacterized protein LOC117322442 [Pecten maximus]|uniref:uncharacterized protein LOC117322442 n=1 Tax=Pecten maximus TaxID=6579 RepID=UPI00145819CE|nr:uncharacterized protein LOC117322442 [Pecten maximus]